MVMAKKHIIYLLLALLAACNGVNAQVVAMCENFDSYDINITPAEWEYDEGEGQNRPRTMFSGYDGTKGLWASLADGGHGVTMQLPQGVSLQQYILSFDFGPRFVSSADLIVGSMADDNAYSSFVAIDTVRIPQVRFLQWWHAEMSLAGLPAGHTVLSFRISSSDLVSAADNMIFDNILITSSVVSGIHVVGTTESSVTVDWSQRGATVDPWLVVMDDAGVVDSFLCDTHPFTVANLRRGTTYTFSLRLDVDYADAPCLQYSDNIVVYLPSDHGNCIAYDDLYADGVQTFCGTYGNPYADTVTVNYGPHSMYSRQTVHVDTAERDPRTGYALRTVPPNGVSSVRLGNWDIDGQAESIVYSVTVDTNSFDLLILNYAAVLQNPNHTADRQPHFLFELLDENYQQIDPSCGAADFVASRDLGWNQCRDEGTLWKDWTTVAFGIAMYHGRTIHVRLTTYDCRYYEHYGYAYFVLDCARSEVSVSSCHGDDMVTLSAPPDFDYVWSPSSAPGDTLSTQQSINVPADGSLYLCRVSFVGRPDCNFSISARAIESRPLAAIDAILLDSCSMRVSFRNISKLISGLQGNYDTADYRTNCRWDFGNGLVSTAADTVVAYARPGIYTVMLSVHYVDCEDVATIHISVPGPYIESDTVLFCSGDSITYDGITYPFDTTLTTVYATTFGCDSIHQLLLAHGKPLSPPMMTVISGVDTFAMGLPLTGCTPMAVTVTDTSRASSWQWTAATGILPGESLFGAEVAFSLSPGCWSLTLVRTDSLGCTDTSLVDSVAIVLPSPHAAFIIELQQIPNFGAETVMLNRSEPDTCTWLWFNNADSATTKDWSYEWPAVNDASEESVTLVASLAHAVALHDSITTVVCTDTAVDTVHILLPWLDFPSLVTPNGDGVNDVWGIVGLLEQGWFVQNELWIFNEWGTLVYHVRDIHSSEQFWNPNERACPDGSYFYRFMARCPYGIVKRNGVIEVVR